VPSRHVQTAARKYYRDNNHDPDVWPNWRVAYLSPSGWYDLGGHQTLKESREVARQWSDHLDKEVFLLNLKHLNKNTPVIHSCKPITQLET
jgi:hypothetical protein